MIPAERCNGIRMRAREKVSPDPVDKLGGKFSALRFFPYFLVILRICLIFRQMRRLLNLLHIFIVVSQVTDFIESLVTVQ